MFNITINNMQAPRSCVYRSYRSCFHALYNLYIMPYIIIIILYRLSKELRSFSFEVFFLIANIGYSIWPEELKAIMNLGLLMVNSLESVRPSCVAPIGSEGRWYILFFLPYGLYVSLVLFLLCRLAASKKRRQIILMITGGFLLCLGATIYKHVKHIMRYSIQDTV